MGTMTKPETQEAVTPELKDWLDRVIVPALVEAYMAEKGVANGCELVQDTAKVVTAEVEK